MLIRYSHLSVWGGDWFQEPLGIPKSADAQVPNMKGGALTRGTSLCDSDGKESACNVGDLGSIPGSGRSPGEGNGYQLQYSCMKIPWTEEPGGLLSMGLQESAMT